jgi:DNA polymerase V
VDSLAELREAIAFYVSRAAEKLRRQRLATRTFVVFLATNRFSEATQCSASVVVNLPVATNLTPELIQYAHEGLEKIYRPGCQFKKAGVSLLELVPARPAQAGLFDKKDRARAQRLMDAIDYVNTRMGVGTLRYAAVGCKQRWLSCCEKRSPRYTTCWNDLLLLPGY